MLTDKSLTTKPGECPSGLLSSVEKHALSLPAEWETSGCVMLAWPHADTDWAYMLEEVQACYLEIARALLADKKHLLIVTPQPEAPRAALAAAGADMSLVHIVEVATNDTWTRDYGPITVNTPEGNCLLDFCFNGWGMKFASDCDNLVNSELASRGYFIDPLLNKRGFVFEGGSFESDGKGTLLTTSRCLLSPNRNGQMSQDDIAKYLTTQLGVSRVLWLDYGYLAGDDTDSHIDTLARFAPSDTILYVGVDNPDDEHYAELCAMEKQLHEMRTMDNNPYRLIKLPLPSPIFDADGERLPATYANFLVTDTSVIVPTYGQPENDDVALSLIGEAFVGYNVVGVDCRALICQHGSLHCATMQISTTSLDFTI